MSRGVFLAGGGSAVQEAAIWARMLDGVVRLLYWPVALSGELLVNAEHWLRSSLGDRPGLGVTVWVDLAEHAGESLGGFDLVFVGGGNTFDLLRRVRTAGLIGPLQDFVAAGGGYYGGSAGAIAAGIDVGLASGLDRDSHQDPDQSGFGLVPADVLPHYGPHRASHALRWSAQHPQRTIVGLPEASGVWSNNSRLVVLGPEPVDVFRGGTQIDRLMTGQVVKAS